MSTETDWTTEGLPADMAEPCANCGWPHGQHRGTTDQCPVSEHRVEWRETKFKHKEACPKCGSRNTEKKHHNPNALAPECDYMACEDCGHQWGHK